MTRNQLPTWKVEKLGRLVSFKTGKLDSNAATLEGKYPFFTCSQQTLRTDTYSFDTEAVLLGGNNANGIYPLKFYSGKFDAYQRTYVIRTLDTKKLKNQYLYYALRLKLDFLRSISTGAATKFLTLTILQDFDLELPSTSIQDKVVDILSAYDDLIENNTRRIKILEEMAQLLYREWFVNFRFPGHQDVPLVESELGLIPQGWEVKNLDEVVEEIIDYRGKTPKKLGSDWSSSGIMAISAKNIKQGRLINLDKANFVDENLYEKWMKTELTQGDILMTSEAPLGELYYMVKYRKFCLSQRVFGIRANQNSIQPVLLFLALASPSGQGELIARQSGTTVLGIRQAELRKVRLIVPPIELQANAAKTLDALCQQIDVLESKNVKLRQTRDLLLPKLISGEIDVESLDTAIADNLTDLAA